jgi:N6-adenosine-specific RNA methylase IME4
MSGIEPTEGNMGCQKAEPVKEKRLSHRARRDADFWARHPISAVAKAWMAIRPVGGFNMLMIDPPWSFNSNTGDNPGRNVRAHYETAPLDWIKALPVRDALAADDALIWLWATNPMLDKAFEVLRAWRCRFSTAGHWVKTTPKGNLSFGGGHVLRSAGEPFLIGRIGRPVVTGKNVRGVIVAQRREHSRKPDEAFRAAEMLMPEARRIEVFSRQARPGWSAWGNEVTKFSEISSSQEA